MIGPSLKRSLEESISISKRFNGKLREHGATLYNALFNVLIVAVLMIAIAIFFNLIGWLSVNIWLAILAFIAGALTFLHPELLITIANIDLLNRSLPEKLQMDAIDALFDTFVRIAKRIIAFCVGLFTFLGIVPLGDNLKVFIIVFISIIIVILINVEDKVATTRSEKGR